MRTKYLIVGAGPTGLGAGRRLTESGEDNFIIAEKNAHVGGLSASFTDRKGFTWDVGGHVVFSHYEYFDKMLDEVLDGDYLEHQREAWIRMAASWVPYPFQNNIRHLPKKQRWDCIEGLLRRNGDGTPKNFQEWIVAIFGQGIADHFMLPYNFKVWATPPQMMDFGWIGERVSIVDAEKVVRNVVMEMDDVSWGPNNTFKFPLQGGTGEIFRRMGHPFRDRIKTETSIEHVDAKTKTAVTGDGEVIEYEHMLYTGPLDLLTKEVVIDVPDPVVRAADELQHNGVCVVGVGVESEKPKDSKCWMYFPESDCPFYRVTNFHNYSPKNVPGDGVYLAYMTETSYSEHKPFNAGAIQNEVEEGLVATGLLEDEDRNDVVNRFEICAEHGYPIPTLLRDNSLGIIQPWLEIHDIYARGRFGGWKYEVGNMDHSVMQGVEWVDRILKGEKETTYTLQ